MQDWLKDITETSKHRKIETIENKRIKWWIMVPVRISDTKTINIKMLADPGANAGA